MINQEIRIQGKDEVIAELQRNKIQISSALRPFVLKHAMATAYHFIQVTEPLAGKGTGGTGTGYKVGEARMSHDIHSIFKPAQSLKFGDLLMADEWKSLNNYKWTPKSRSIEHLVNSNQYGTLKNIFKANGWKPPQVKFADYPMVNTQKNSRSKGKVSGNPVYIRGGNDAIKEFFKRRARTIGLVASGWWDCITQLKGTSSADHAFSVSSFVKKSNSNGSATISTNSDSSYVTIRNKVGDYDGLLTKSGGLMEVLNFRRKAFISGLQKEVSRIISQSKLGK